MKKFKVGDEVILLNHPYKDIKSTKGIVYEVCKHGCDVFLPLEPHYGEDGLYFTFDSIELSEVSKSPLWKALA